VERDDNDGVSLNGFKLMVVLGWRSCQPRALKPWGSHVSKALRVRSAGAVISIRENGVNPALGCRRGRKPLLDAPMGVKSVLISTQRLT